tara:strand:- start:605 stop:1045 length:441 start_codon:yes stop_codon:yes gene_type:complete
MNKFSNAKIYRIVNDINGMTYYGSTHQKLSKRMGDHRSDYKIKKHKTYLKFGEISDCKIFLVENFPCNSKEELKTRERFFIENYPCVNKNIPGRSKVEYMKHYRLDNKIYINAKYNCSCGGRFTNAHKARHLTTKKHINHLKSLSV